MYSRINIFKFNSDCWDTKQETTDIETINFIWIIKLYCNEHSLYNIFPLGCRKLKLTKSCLFIFKFLLVVWIYWIRNVFVVVVVVVVAVDFSFFNMNKKNKIKIFYSDFQCVKSGQEFLRNFLLLISILFFFWCSIFIFHWLRRWWSFFSLYQILMFVSVSLRGDLFAMYCVASTM